MRSICLWICLILISLPTSAAEYGISRITETSATLTLQEAIALAREANPDIAIAIREREAIDGVRTQAAVRPNPSITTAVEATRNATQKTLVQINQPLELGNKRGARIDAAEARYAAATADLEAKENEIQANVISSFYEVLAAQQRMALARSFLDIAAQARDAASKRVQAGKISPVEETKSRVAESAVKIETNQASSALATARKRLSALWGNPQPRFREVAGNIEDIPTSTSFEALVTRLDDAPAMRRAKLEVATREALAQVEYSRKTPDLTVSVGAQRSEELDTNQAVLGLTIPIPVFDRNQGNYQEALSRRDKARDELTALSVDLQTRLSDSYQRLEVANDSAQALHTDILPGAQSAFDAASKGFLYGKFSYLDVLDAQRTLFQAQTQYLGVLLEAHQASADIERILGQTNASSEVTP